MHVNSAAHIHVNYDATTHVPAVQRRSQEARISAASKGRDNVRIFSASSDIGEGHERWSPQKPENATRLEETRGARRAAPARSKSTIVASPRSVQTTENHYTTLKHEAAPVHFAIDLVSCQLTGDSLDLNRDCFVSASRAESALRGQDVEARGAGACRQAAGHPCGARSQPRTDGYELAGVPAA